MLCFCNYLLLATVAKCILALREWTLLSLTLLFVFVNRNYSVDTDDWPAEFAIISSNATTKFHMNGEQNNILVNTCTCE